MVAAKLISSSTKVAAKVKVGGCHQQASFFDNVNIIGNIPTKRWLDKLQDVAHDAEDVLDEFDYEQKGKVCDFVSLHNPIVFRTLENGS